MFWTLLQKALTYSLECSWSLLRWLYRHFQNDLKTTSIHIHSTWIWMKTLPKKCIRVEFRCPPLRSWFSLSICDGRGGVGVSQTDRKTDRRRVIQAPPFLNFIEIGEKVIGAKRQWTAGCRGWWQHSGVFILNKNAPALTHLPRICHSRFCHTVVIWLHSVTSTDVMTSFCDITRRHIIGQDIWPWECWLPDRQMETRTDGNTGPILVPRPLTREVITQ